MPTRPPTRSLVRTLRNVQRGRPLRLRAAGVTGVPDSAHVTVDFNGDGDTLTVPRLASYTAPAVGDAVYCLADSSMVICLGTCK